MILFHDIIYWSKYLAPHLVLNHSSSLDGTTLERHHLSSSTQISSRLPKRPRKHPLKFCYGKCPPPSLTWQQILILYSWATQRGLAVIPKSNNQARLEQNLRVTDFDMEKEDIDSITKLDCDLRFNNPTDVNFPKIDSWIWHYPFTNNPPLSISVHYTFSHKCDSVKWQSLLRFRFASLPAMISRYSRCLYAAIIPSEQFSDTHFAMQSSQFLCITLWYVISMKPIDSHR